MVAFTTKAIQSARRQRGSGALRCTDVSVWQEVQAMVGLERGEWV
jgi:hypothetical protein